MFQIIFHWLQQTSTGGVQVYKDEEINKPREPIQEVNCLFPPHLQTSGTFRRAAESHITSPSVYHYINVFKKRQSRHISEETSIIDTRCRAERSRLQSWARRLNVWASRWRALNCWHESCGTFWDSIKSMSHLKSSAYKIITRFKRLNHLCLLNIEWSISHGRKRFFSQTSDTSDSLLTSFKKNNFFRSSRAGGQIAACCSIANPKRRISNHRVK